ncbi:hypothetical protein BRC86_09100 [Halobacteriales archaeon QS_3_64_16]|nr:MAG: hypothetical protein BRC86_09100 [Halobacteriales archaeon QS_3_64_16]
MAERSEERTRDRESGTDTSWTDVDVDGLLAKEDEGDVDTRSTESTPAQSAEGGRGGLRNRFRERRAGLFSLRVFVLALVLAVAGGLVGGSIPLLSTVAGAIAVFATGFVVGLAIDGRHYTETGLAGAGAAVASLLLSNSQFVFLAAFRDFALQFGVIGAGTGLLVALVGHYFGRDLRVGLTQDI